MADYILVTENTADLSADYCEEHQVYLMYLSYIINGVNYTDQNRQSPKDFYRQMREGSMPTTSQVSLDQAITRFKEFLSISKNIIYVAFSSGLSGTYNSVAMAARTVMEEQPGCRITVIDSLCASGGEGLLMWKAIQLRDQGMPYEELVRWIEENKLHVCHFFTVDDLFHLHRGGRVSRATAIVGTLVNIKPVLHVDNEGHLISIGKARGRKKALSALVDSMEEHMGSWKDKNDMIIITHGDCEEDANFVRDLIEKRYGFPNFQVEYLGATVGAHTGPGLVALFYMGDRR